MQLNVIKHHLNDIELEFLDQRTKGGIEINKMNKKNVIYLAKKDFAENFFDKNAINAGGVKIDNTVYSGADYQGDGGGGGIGGGRMSASDFSDDTAGTPFRRGGIASL